MISPAQPGLPYTAQTTARGRWIAITVIVLATLIGGGVRLHDLGGGGVWFDELYTLRDLTDDHKGKSPTRWLGYQPTRWVMQAQGVSPDTIPGERYYEYKDAGFTLAQARLAACLLGIFTIPLLAWSAWRPFGPGVAAVLAVLIALCVWNVGWSQATRFYTQVGLLGGLAVLWYIDAVTTGSRWRFAGATVMVVLAYLTHPPALTIGGALMLDAIVRLARRQPLNYGVWGWSWAVGSIAVCLTVFTYERRWHRRYDFTAGGSVGSAGEGGPLAQSPMMVLVYFAIMLTPVLVAAAMVGLYAGRRLRGVWVLAFAAIVPLLAITAISASGGYAHARYAYVAMAGWLGLGAVGLSILAQVMRPRLGPVLAWSPAVLLVVAMLPTLGSYLTTGHRFIEPFHLGWQAVADQVEPGDVVFAERYEVAEYYLGRDDVYSLPGRISAMDEQAGGREAWIIRLSGNSRGPRQWEPAEDPRMQLFYRASGAVWLPRREVSVYRLSPPGVGSADQANAGGQP